MRETNVNGHRILPIVFSEKEISDTLQWKKSVVRLPVTEQYADINRSPYSSGDILWAQEAWAMQQGLYWHKAGLVLNKAGQDLYGTVAPTKWKHPRSMPFDAARIFLRVTGVEISRLNDMTEDDFTREGFTSDSLHAVWYRFSVAWDKKLRATDRKRFGWASNPLVWVIRFDRISSTEVKLLLQKVRNSE